MDPGRGRRRNERSRIERLKLIVVIHPRAIAAVGAMNFVFFPEHREVFPAAGAMIADIVQMLTDAALRFPTDMAFVRVDILIALKRQVDLIVDFLFAQTRKIIRAEKKRKFGLALAKTLIEADFGVGEIFTAHLQKIDRDIEML